MDVELLRLRALAAVLRRDRCEVVTTPGVGHCYTAGRVTIAEFGADQACVPCIVDRFTRGLA